MATPTAKISITITDFTGLRDMSDPTRFCVIADPVIDPIHNAGGRVTNSMNGDALTLRITNGKANQSEKAKPVNLEFTILPASQYIVAGLIFNQDGLADNGSKKANFKIMSIKRNVITIKNSYTVGKTYWNFLIGVQQTALSGAIGLIDPGVENSEDA